MHDSLAIANRFIELSGDRGLTLMQILKLSYFAHGFKMAFDGADHPLSKEFVQAWKFGPVFPNVYREFREEPPGRIRELATYLDTRVSKLKPIVSNFSNEEDELIATVYDIYGIFDGWKLSVLTHKKGTAWYKA